ncbi:MAG: recombinase family protein [Chloroflexi bacterium]|nr:recombinase family protein [Chloroflexota bacterium]
MSKLALYCRVSTDTQESDNQLLELRQWAESKGHAVVAEYVDVASCARRRERLGRPPGKKDSRKRVVRRRSWVGVSIPMGQ